MGIESGQFCSAVAKGQEAPGVSAPGTVEDAASVSVFLE